MKISRKGKTGCALVLAALMTLTGVSITQTYAADAIDVSKTDCSITVSVDIVVAEEAQAGQNQKYVEDFKKMSIPVNIYRVAEVDVTGQKYTNIEPFKNVDLSDISSKTTAAEWKAKAEAAAEELENAQPTAQKVTEAGVARFENLATGMYLVVPEATYNTDYTTRYTFTPYLTALPGNPYATAGGDDNGYGQGADEWIYETEIGLKPEAEPQFGHLDIHKVLLNFNETLGQTTFVFRVEAIDEDGNLLYDSENRPVYSEVVSTTHEGLATETVTLDKIPAGVTVRVTEVYSGASYEIAGTGAVTQDVLIWSDAAIGQTVGGAVIETAAVTFENKYNGGNRGGYGVTNEFTNGSAGWEWTSGPAEEE